MLEEVKKNLNIEDCADDDLLTGMTESAISYAERYQNAPPNFYKSHEMPESTRQAVIMLASFFYESRTGGTGGYMADSPAAAAQIWQSAERLLEAEKRWDF